MPVGVLATCAPFGLREAMVSLLFTTLLLATPTAPVARPPAKLALVELGDTSGQPEKALLPVPPPLRASLEQALAGSGKVELVDPKALDGVAAELLKRNDPLAGASTFPALGKLGGASMIVGVALVALEPAITGAALAPRVPGLQGLEPAAPYAYVAFELRLVDRTTGRVLFIARADAVEAGKSAGEPLAMVSPAALGSPAVRREPLGRAVIAALAAATEKVTAWADALPPPPAAKPAKGSKKKR